MRSLYSEAKDLARGQDDDSRAHPLHVVALPINELAGRTG
jgi:hypothetical protein